MKIDLILDAIRDYCVLNCLSMEEFKAGLGQDKRGRIRAVLGERLLARDRSFADLFVAQKPAIDVEFMRGWNAFLSNLRANVFVGEASTYMQGYNAAYIARRDGKDPLTFRLSAFENALETPPAYKTGWRSINQRIEDYAEAIRSHTLFIQGRQNCQAYHDHHGDHSYFDYFDREDV